MTVDTELSSSLSQKIRAKDRLCFTNSVHALLTFPKGTRGLRYVEGYAISKYGMVVLHGWLEYGGKVVEVTPVWLADVEHTSYFPARRFTRSEVCRRIHRVFPLVGDWHRNDEGLRQSYKAAMIFQYGEEAYAHLHSFKEAT